MPESDNNTATSIAKKSFICIDCGKPFDSGRALGGHKKIHPRYTDDNPLTVGIGEANRENTAALPPVPLPVRPPHQRRHLVIPTENALPRHHGNPYATPNHDEVVAKLDDAPPPPVMETPDLLGKYWTPVGNAQAGRGPTEGAKSSGRTVSNPAVAEAAMGFGEQEINVGHVDVDLDLKL